MSKINKIKGNTKIKANTLVVLDIHYLERNSAYANMVDYYKQLLDIGDGNRPVLCLGEITNQKGHYAVVAANGKTIVGLHPEIFRLPTDDEL